MKDPYVEARFQEIDTAIQRSKLSSADDVYLQSCLASYLVVLISGYYEDTVEHLVGVRAGKAGDPDLQNLVKELVSYSFKTPNWESIKRLIGLFNNESYKKVLDKKVDDKARAAISSIVTNRHSIAHGKPIAVTLGDVESFHNSSKPVFEALEDILI